MKSLSIAVFGGGTIEHVRPHLALCAPAYGGTAKFLAEEFKRHGHGVSLFLTKMADCTSSIITNSDLALQVAQVTEDRSVDVIVMNAAVTDFQGTVDASTLKGRRLATRTSDGGKALYTMSLSPTEKIVSKIRHGENGRKDVFLVSTKTTFLSHLPYTGGDVTSSEAKAIGQEMYLSGLKLLKETSSNLVLVNDIFHRLNMIVVPEEAQYSFTHDRGKVLTSLVHIIEARSGLHYTKSNVIPGDLVPWGSDAIPETLREVVNHCVQRGAYKPFLGKTAGHFAVKLGTGEFLTSPRKRNFNDLAHIGMVRVVASGEDSIVAYGAKPSVGGQSQRAVFASHPELDSIVHFHCEKKSTSQVPVRSQLEYECGSHECGYNTASGLREVVPNIFAVHLDNHGPNIVFDSKAVSKDDVIGFIENNWDLSQKSGGFQLQS